MTSEIASERARPTYVKISVYNSLVLGYLQSVIAAADNLSVVGDNGEGRNAPHPPPIRASGATPVIEIIEATALKVTANRESCVLLVPDLSAEDARLAIQQGVRAIVAESVAERDIVPAIRAVANGDGFLSDRLVRRILDWVADWFPAHTVKIPLAIRQLSPREREVLAYLADGAPNDEIARAMNISVTTVRSHIYHMTIKLNLNSRAEAVIFGYEWRSLWNWDNGLLSRRTEGWAIRPPAQHGQGRIRTQ